MALSEQEEFELLSLEREKASSQPRGPSAPSIGERGQAALGGVNKGMAGLAGLPVDTVENIINLGLAAYGRLSGKGGDAPEPLAGSVGGSEWIKQQMGGAGIQTVNPRPDDPASRMLHTAGTIAGGSMVPGANVPNTVAAATGGAVAGEVLGPEWAGVGAMAPAAAGQALGAAKNAIAARTAPNVETFRQAGTTPSVGQATGNTFVQGLENLASKFPGGAGIMRRFTEAQQRSMGARARTGVSGEAAGRAIEKGITGEGGFLERSKATWQKLDNEVAAKIPAGQVVQPTNTLQTLDDLATPVKGIGRTHSMASLLDDMRSFLTGKPVGGGHGKPAKASSAPTYQDLRALRSRVGELTDDALVSGVSVGEAKKLYAALSKDLEAAANQAGAGKEFARQNEFYRARMGRVEDVLDRVIGKGKQPEDIFKSFMPSDPDQANKVRAVMRSLDPSQRKVVTDAVVNRLGRATPGRQDEIGEVFSSEAFLTNWNKLSTGAKAQLFPNHSMRQNVEAIAKAAASIREGSKVFQNASGTAGSFAAYSVYASPIAAVATGSFAPVVAAGGAAGTAYIGAKMLTSPKVVEWLARPVNPLKPAEAVGHLARLSVIYNQTSDRELKQELERFIASVGQQQ